MYKIIASDMDGTFLDGEHRVPPANVEAILKAREKGCLFVPASGRGYASILHSLRDLPAACLDGSYVVSYNGACINRVGDPEPLTSLTMPLEAVRTLFEATKPFDVGCHIYALDGSVWVWRLAPEEVAFIEDVIDYEVIEGDSIDFLRDVPLAKIIFCKVDLPYLHEMADGLAPVAASVNAEVTFSSGRYAEYCPRGVDKGYGVAKLAELLGIDMADVICVGDSLNDLQMIEVAGVGVAAANFTDHIDERAQYVTRATNEDGVIAEVVERFLS